MRVLGPSDSLVCPRGRENDAVRQGQLQFVPQLRSGHRQLRIQRHYHPLLHVHSCLDCLILATLLEYAFEDLVNGDSRGNQAGDVLDSGREEIARLSPGKIFQPGGGVHHIHMRSGSRSMWVSIPFRNPRIRRIGCTGINSMRPSYSMTRHFWPGRMPRCFRTCSGITTWYLEETLTVSIRNTSLASIAVA